MSSSNLLMMVGSHCHLTNLNLLFTHERSPVIGEKTHGRSFACNPALSIVSSKSTSAHLVLLP
jgi:urease beta subunit